MVSYKELKNGKNYKLGDIIVGKFVRVDRDSDDDIVLIFTDSQHGDPGENTIYPDEEDDFEETKRNSVGSTKNKRSKKNKTKNKKTNTRTKQKSKRFSNKKMIKTLGNDI
jgi:hypothetical protein